VDGKWPFQPTVLLLVVAIIGAGLTGQVGAARLLFAIGRDNVLPKRFFAYLSPRRNNPTFNLVLIGVFTFAGSLGQRYELVGERLNFGAFLGSMGVNVAAIRQFYFLSPAGQPKSFWKDFLLPGLGFLFCLAIWLGLGKLTKIVGCVWFAWPDLLRCLNARIPV
jgi:putrescine importer